MVRLADGYGTPSGVILLDWDERTIYQRVSEYGILWVRLPKRGTGAVDLFRYCCCIALAQEAYAPLGQPTTWRGADQSFLDRVTRLFSWKMSVRTRQEYWRAFVSGLHNGNEISIAGVYDLSGGEYSTPDKELREHVRALFNSIDGFVLGEEQPVGVGSHRLPAVEFRVSVEREVDFEEFRGAVASLLRPDGAGAIPPTIDSGERPVEPKPFCERQNLTAQVAPTRLRHGAEHLVGRDDELAHLDAAWTDPKTHVVTIVAWGGVGKTSLVAHWMGRLATDRWRGARRVFDWSFYSQGSSGPRVASSDQFIAEALKFFGDPDFARSNAHAWDKGARLAQLVARERHLLVLDGLEPLQHPPGPMGGRLKDHALESLLKGLAQRNEGLCVVTTRQRVADLARFHDTTTSEWELAHLSEEAGAVLLWQVGVKRAGAADIKPNDSELRGASREVHGHALTLNLLGRYLALAYGGDLRQRKRVAFHIAHREVTGGHAFRVMAAYEKWLAAGGARGQSQLSALRLLGLFNGPAHAKCLAALRNEPAIPGLTDSLVGLDDPQWNTIISRLEECGLLSIHQEQPAIHHPDPEVDAHPLVREYLARQLRKHRSEAWREGHRRLYHYFKGATEEYPSTLAALMPLYDAVVHGCHGDLHQESFDDIYVGRILRDTEFVSTDKFGAHCADLAALSAFFEVPWSEPAAELRDIAKARIMVLVGYRLRALCQLRDAEEAWDSASRQHQSLGDWSGASADTSNLSQLLVSSGDVRQAVERGRESVRFADRSRKRLRRTVNRATLADALHHAGNLAEAATLFEAAEGIQKRGKTGRPLLYLSRGFRYCDLLLSQGHYDAVVGRTQKTIAWAKEERVVFAIAMDNLTLGRAALHQMQTGETWDGSSAEAHLDRAVREFRSSGLQYELPHALLARAQCCRLAGEYREAWTYLDEIREIAERAHRQLHWVHYQLEAARLCMAQFDAQQSAKRLLEARKRLATIRPLLEKMGYARRIPEYELAAARLALLEGHVNEFQEHWAAAEPWVLPLTKGGKGFVCYLSELQELKNRASDFD